MNAEWQMIVDFNDKYFPGWRTSNPVFLSNALAGEVGEYCNTTKHLLGGGTHHVDITTDDMADELADIFVYLVLCSETIFFDQQRFSEAVRKKMEINKTRMEERHASDH